MTRVTYDDASRAGPHSPNSRTGTVYTQRRSHSSEGYLEGHSRANNNSEQSRYTAAAAVAPPPYHKNRAPPSYENHRPLQGEHAPASPTHINHQFSNEILERYSDSESEIYHKKETKKKSSIKSKLRGLYKGSSSSAAKTKSSLDGGDRKGGGVRPAAKPAPTVNQFGYQPQTVSTQSNDLSPKRTIPTFNTYSKSPVK